MNWLNRWTHYCLTAVDGLDRDSTLTAVGAEPGPAAHRDTVQLTSAGSTQILFEPGSIEATRPEVLRRLSAGGRALAYARTGDGMQRLGYAENGTLTAVFEPGIDDRDGTKLATVRNALGAPPRTTTDLFGRTEALVLMASSFGVELGDDLFQHPDRVAPLLPILPDVPETADMRVLFDYEADFSALLKSAPPRRTAAAVSVVAHQAAAAAGLSGHPLVTEALAAPTPITNESGLGHLLRTTMADRRHGQAAKMLHTALSATPETAAALLARTHSEIKAMTLMADALADIEVPEPVRRAEHEKAASARKPLGRSLSFPVDPAHLPPVGRHGA